MRIVVTALIIIGIVLFSALVMFLLGSWRNAAYSDGLSQQAYDFNLWERELTN